MMLANRRIVTGSFVQPCAASEQVVRLSQDSVPGRSD